MASSELVRVSEQPVELDKRLDEHRVQLHELRVQAARFGYERGWSIPCGDELYVDACKLAFGDLTERLGLFHSSQNTSAS